MSQKTIYILGVGNNTAVLIDLAECCGYQVLGLYHFTNEKNGDTYLNIPILGSYDELFEQNTLSSHNFALSMGDNTIRASLGKKLRSQGANMPNLLHPTAAISRYAKFGQGNIVCSNATIDPNVTIQNDCVISANSMICHNSQLDDACFVGAGSVLGAYVHVKEFAFLGLSTVAVSGKVTSIGEHSVVGAGAIVTKNVTGHDTVVGSPARSIKQTIS